MTAIAQGYLKLLIDGFINIDDVPKRYLVEVQAEFNKKKDETTEV